MGTMTDDSHGLILFNGVLADGAIVILCLKCSSENGARFNLLRAGVYDNTLIQKGFHVD
jgi:hypothetical protein